MKRLHRPNPVVFLLCGMFSIAAQAQESDWEKAFWQRAKEHAEAFDATTRSHFEKMRSNFNAEYAEALNGIWKEYQVIAPTPRPQRIEPKTPPVAPKEALLPEKPLNVIPEKVVLPPPVVKPIQLTIPDNPCITVAKNVPSMKVDFFETICEIGLYSFEPISYNHDRLLLGDEWKKLESNENTDKLIDDCVRLREALSLCDMGYLWLCETISARIYPQSKDSQAFLTAYLMNQTGYDVKLGLTRKGLTVLMHTDLPLDGQYSIMFSDTKYFVRDKELALLPIRSYEGFYAPSETIPLRIVPDRMPKLDPKRISPVVYSSKQWSSEPEFQVTVSKHEMEFFADYPWMSWEHYIRAPLSDNFRNEVLPPMREMVSGLSTFDGVRKLLSFVQFGFEYMTDNDQYGHEKVNFPEENFYYPANDCEDRSILFATLVREIYGLDVVLLHYPNHLSTAVDFGDPTIKGDAISLDSHHYVMCDPTYIGARIGMTMDQYRGVMPEVYRQ